MTVRILVIVSMFMLYGCSAVQSVGEYFISDDDDVDAPAPLVFEDGVGWSLGEPDLVIKTEPLTMLAGTPDWWGELKSFPITGLEQDRYVKSVEVIEVNDGDFESASETVIGGRYVFHHLAWSTSLDEYSESEQLFTSDTEATTFWPIHELGRNPDIFDPEGGRLLRNGSTFVGNSVHLHSNGRDTAQFQEGRLPGTPAD